MPLPGVLVRTEVNWSGDLTTWVDLGYDPQSYDIGRGRSDDLATMAMGTCTIRLHDHTGKYSATSATSPYAGLIRPMRRVRVIATVLGTDYGLFYGFLSRCETNPDYGTQTATLEASDLFVWLNRVTPTIAATGSTTTGAAIGLLLDAIGWTDPTLRSLATGDTLPNFSADGSASALSIIGDLLATERGLFFIDGDGVAVYQSRHTRSAQTTSLATIPGTMQAVSSGTDIATIYNRATVTAGAGTPQTYYDATSGTEFGPADFGAISSAYLATDAQAASLAQFIVRQRKDPLPTARRVTLDAILDTVRVPMVGRDLGDRVTVTNTLSGVSGDYYIEQITHAISVSGSRYTTAWNLSQRSTLQPFTIGVSTLGGTDQLTY